MPTRQTPVRSFLALLTVWFPLTAQAALVRVGPPIEIAAESPCSFQTPLDVASTPRGAFEVVWADDWDYAVRGRRFARDLRPSGPPETLMLYSGGDAIRFSLTWAGTYELAMPLAEGEYPSNPLAGYRARLDLDGDLLAPPARVKPPHFFTLAPLAGGDSLQFRWEPPLFGRPDCQSRGLLVRRIDIDGNPLSTESRVSGRASAWYYGYSVIEAARLQDDRSIVVYGTCDKFTGLVARKLNAAGATVGKAIDLPLPGVVGGFSDGSLALAARGVADFAVAAMVSRASDSSSSLYTRAVVNGGVFGPTLIPSGAGVVDLAASPSGRYLLLFVSHDPSHRSLLAQELSAQGVPIGTPLALRGPAEFGVDVAGAIAVLPNGRWLVVTRAQSAGVYAEDCRERLIGTVLANE